MKTPRAFLELSTHLMKDLKDWTEEATIRKALSPEDLKSLQEGAAIVERITLTLSEVGDELSASKT